MKYLISIEETVVEEFEVDADSPEDVLAIASDKYYKEEFVLSPGEVQERKMAILLPEQYATDWDEF